MRFFLRSKRFKIICGITAGLIALSIVLRLIGGVIAPQASILGAVAQPVRSVATYFSNKIDDFKTKYYTGDQLLKENQKLQSRLDELTSQVVDYNDLKKENDFLKGFLEIKEKHKDWKFESATLISRDHGDSGASFTINKGSVNGVSARDPVITSSGLVGYITEVGPSYSKVTTILSEDINVGGLDYRTSDVGVVSGDAKYVKKGQCVLKNLPRSCSVALNDIVVTAGGEIFPEGLVIGTIESISSDENQTAITAVLKPGTDISEIRDVMVLTYFEGQGTLDKK